MQGSEPYVTARNPPANHQPQASELFTQPSLGFDQHKD